MPSQLTVLVADDHVGLAAALTQALGQHYLTECAVNSPAQLRSAVRAWQARKGWQDGPLVVLLDIAFGEHAESGLEVLADLATGVPEARYVMHTLHASRVFVQQALELGALGFVDKCCGLAELREAIEAAAVGRSAVFTKEDVGVVWGGGRLRPAKPLTPALRTVLALLQAGHKRREIAEILGVTLSAVEGNITRLRRAYGLRAGTEVDWRVFSNRCGEQG